MKILRVIKDNLSQILAITEKNIKIDLRFKYGIFIKLVTPLLAILMPLIIMGKFFEFNDSFGPWNRDNYLVFPLLAYNITLLIQTTAIYTHQFRLEKYWKTLSALIIAPFNRFNLLLGIFIAHLVLISIPFTILLIICYLYYPISLFTILTIIFIFFLIALVFSGIGLILGVFYISNENISSILAFGVNLIFWISCLSYPYQFFPEFIQKVINLNPLYYFFDFLRLAWIEDNIVQTISTYYFNFFLLIIFAITLPFIGVFTFNKVYRKYGIVGY